MNQKIIVYMVVRNVSKRTKLFTDVITQASRVSKDFFIVNHGSDDNTTDIIDSLALSLGLNLELVGEEFIGTMDDIKGKYYRILKERYGKERNFILMLDWDELLDDKLVSEMNSLDFKSDVYFINRHTYLIRNPIDRNAYLPLLFEINSVEVTPLKKFHKLYRVNSKNIKKLKGVLHHYSYSSVQDLISKDVYYSRNEAIDLFEKNSSLSGLIVFFKFLSEGTLYFLYSLLYHFNFLTLEGWFYSINWYVYKFYKYLFYLELKNDKQEKRSGNL